MTYIDSAKTVFPDVDIDRQAMILSAILTYYSKNGNSREIAESLQKYLGTVPPESADPLVTAGAYYSLNEYDKAFAALEGYTVRDDKSYEDIHYYELSAMLYQHTGQLEKAMESFDKYLTLRENKEHEHINQDMQFIEERQSLERQVASERMKNRNIVEGVIIFVVIVLLVITILAQNVRIGQRHRKLYRELKEERSRLMTLLKKSDGMNGESRKIIVDRLEMLNDFFRSYMTQTTDKRIENTKRFIADTPAFMTSLRETFSVTHPNFIKHLNECGFTTEEVECCCLYAIGLSGKEIANYMKRAGHYKESSRIRSKLGLEEHDTNLSIYIQNLLLGR